MPSDRTDISVGRSQWAIATADINADAIPDLIASLQDDSSLAILRGLGGRQFTSPERIFQSPPPLQLAIDGAEDSHRLIFTERQGRLNSRAIINDRLAPQEMIMTMGVGEELIAIVEHRGRPLLLYNDYQQARARFLDGSALELSKIERWLPVYGVAGIRNELIAVRRDGTIIRADPSQRHCAIGRELRPWRYAALGDLDNDGVLDAVASATCRECTSNHVFLRGVR
jgi:hypothetical protein